MISQYDPHQTEFFIIRDDLGLSIRGIHGFLIYIDSNHIARPKSSPENFVLIDRNYDFDELVKALHSLPSKSHVRIPVSLTRNPKNQFVIEISDDLDLDRKDATSDEFVFMVNILEN